VKAEVGRSQVPRVNDLLEDAIARLSTALGFERRDARLEAQILASRALGVNRSWLIAHDQDVLTPAQAEAVEALVARRAQGEPVAYILGEKEFYGHLFKVNSEVLIPRPETELLVEIALERLPKERPARVLDLGTGSGCVAISIALSRPDCEVLAVDASARAVELAKQNAIQLGAQKVRFLVSDWYSQLPAMNFDMIVSNPPYIASEDPHLGKGDLIHEPPHALASGPEGLDAIRIIVAGNHSHLHPGAWLILEHGYDQSDSCQTLFTEAGLEQVFTLSDLAGQARVTGGQWQGTQ
jgi:release factor glutamine methyltransferase